VRATGIIRRTRGLAAVLTLATALVAGYLWQGQASAGEGGAPRYGATDLADAVLFNEGPAARHLESLGRGQVPWNDVLREGQKAVHDAIDRDPRWARSFAARLQSGDPQRVQSSLEDLSKVTLGSLERVLGRDRVDEAVYRIIRDVYGDDVLKILRSSSGIPLNLQKVSYPCCLEDYIDPMSISILVAFVHDMWQVEGVAVEVNQAVQEIMISQVANELQVG
jgi:hypothetical protein